jgi:iron complex outermembrane receptor protein
MLGLAVVRTLGPAELSLHSAFGKGIRPPASGVLNASRMSQRDPGEPAALDPESQSGVESGLALSFGRTFTMQATRFDQVASGLIQNVAVGVDSALRNGYQDRRLRYRLQNVGQIGNHGWELQSTLRRGSLALDGAVTLVDSRVRAIADGYMGDLRPDDRLLAVPARTSSLSASWTATRWFASLSATRAENWINYDRLALARAIGSGGGPSMRELVGSHLRAYWLDYDGQTRLRLTGSRELGRGIELLLTGDNLLGGQLGEPDNVTIRPGRTVTGGLRASF